MTIVIVVAIYFIIFSNIAKYPIIYMFRNIIIVFTVCIIRFYKLGYLFLKNANRCGIRFN